ISYSHPLVWLERRARRLGRVLATVAAVIAGVAWVVPAARAEVPHTVSADLEASADTGALHAVTPVRLLDSRTGTKPAAGAALDVTATEPERAGFLTVYPCDAPLPVASNVNYTAGESVADAAIVGLAADGTVCVYTSAASHVVVDLNGWFGPAGKATFAAQAP